MAVFKATAKIVNLTPITTQKHKKVLNVLSIKVIMTTMQINSNLINQSKKILINTHSRTSGHEKTACATIET